VGGLRRPDIHFGLCGHAEGSALIQKQESISICLIGGIYGKDRDYRSKVKMTPETILESGFRARGHRVITLGHREKLDSQNAAIIHVHHLGYGAIRAAVSSGKAPFVYTSHDPLAMSGMLARSKRFAADFVMSRADAVVALSEYEAGFQRRTYPLDGAMHKVIPNGINTDNYRYSRENDAGRSRSWQLLVVGQLIEQKGVDRLLQALALLPENVELQLVFHVDALRDKLEKLAGELGLRKRVKFLGARSPIELREIYQRSDLLVLPSLAEALPSVITEAMLCGTPIISSDVGGIRDQLGGFGLLVAPGRVEELATAIRRALNDYGEFAEKSEAMSQYAHKRFSIDAMVEHHIELYRILLSQKGSPRRARKLRQPLNLVAQLAVNRPWKT